MNNSPRKIRTVREATGEERDRILAAREANSHAAEDVLKALRKRFTPESIAAAVAKLPADAQARFAAEFTPKPVRRIERIRITKKRP